MRSSPKFHAWLIAHPTFGPIHEAWTRRGAIPTSAKRTSVIMISLSAGTIWAWVDPLPVKIGLTILLAGVSLFVLTRPS